MDDLERITAIKKLEQDKAEWAKQRVIDDAADRAIFAPWEAWRAMREAGEAAGERMAARQVAAASARTDFIRACEQIAPQCLKDAQLKINREIEHRRAAGQTDRTRNPWGATAEFVFRPLTEAEQAAVVRAEQVKTQLESLFTVAEDLRPHIARLFTKLASDDAAAATQELVVAPPKPAKKQKPASEPNIGEFVGPSNYGAEGRLTPVG